MAKSGRQIAEDLRRLSKSILRSNRGALAATSPAARIAHLRELARQGLEPKRCGELIRKIESYYRQLELVCCSGPWLAAARDRFEDFPIPGMRLSREEARFGETGIPHRRATPGIAVNLEDQLDQLDCIEALDHEFPPSPSAVVLGQIHMRRWREPVQKRDQSGKRKKSPEPVKYARALTPMQITTRDGTLGVRYV